MNTVLIELIFNFSYSGWLFQLVVFFITFQNQYLVVGTESIFWAISNCSSNCILQTMLIFSACVTVDHFHQASREWSGRYFHYNCSSVVSFDRQLKHWKLWKKWYTSRLSTSMNSCWPVQCITKLWRLFKQEPICLQMVWIVGWQLLNKCRKIFSITLTQ